MKTFTLSPSDFGFLYNECKRCYYNKYVKKMLRPKYYMPAIFTKIDKHMTSYFDNLPTSIIDSSLPSGIVTLGGLRVKSLPIISKAHNCQIILEGRIDSLLKFDDDTFAVMDFKTTELVKSSSELYFNQLMSYVIALEYNDPEYTKTCEISRLGLCCFVPSGFSGKNSVFSLNGSLSWIEIIRDDAKFKKFIKEVAGVLTMKSAPDPGEKCSFCKFKEC